MTPRKLTEFVGDNFTEAEKRADGCGHLSCRSQRFSMSKAELIPFPQNLFLFWFPLVVPTAPTTVRHSGLEAQSSKSPTLILFTVSFLYRKF